MHKPISKRIIGGIAAALFGVIVALNTFTIVDEGTVKVQTTVGKINPVELKEGLHFVNPISSFDTFNTRNQKYEENGISIPTNDRFNSTGNVTVIYRVDGSLAPKIKEDYGTSKQFVDVALKQYIRSYVRDEGRKLTDSRSLAVSSNVSDMQYNLKSRLTDAVSDTGITIEEVLIQEIQFDPRIANQILATQQRIQQEEAEKSKERIAQTKALTAAATAKGIADSDIEKARGAAQSTLLQANADKQAAITRAEGEATAIKLLAAANIELNKSLTPQILEKHRLENEAILFGKSKGNVPHTVIGKTDLRAIGVPVATSTGK